MRVYLVWFINQHKQHDIAGVFVKREKAFACKEQFERNGNKAWCEVWDVSDFVETYKVDSLQLR